MIFHLLCAVPLLHIRLAVAAFVETVKITLAALVFGLAFRALREHLKKNRFSVNSPRTALFCPSASLLYHDLKIELASPRKRPLQ